MTDGPVASDPAGRENLAGVRSGVLRSETVLQRRQRLRLVVDGDRVECEISGDRLELGSRALGILDAFSVPRTVAEAIQQLSRGVISRAHWIEVTQALQQLFDLGVLVPAGSEGHALDPTRGTFASPWVHVAMLEDRTRTSRYLEAIRRTVRADDVVLDLGTGTGVLAIAAAKAGARKVYAMEATGVADAAAAMFIANGVTDRVELLRGWSTELSLPEKATLLVSELIGNDPLAEQVLETLVDARQRLLAPDARLLPRELVLECTLVEVPEIEEDRRLFTVRNAERWCHRYHLDFSALTQLRSRAPGFFRTNPYRVREWPRLGGPADLLRLDLGRVTGFGTHATADLVCTRPGRLNGVLITFRGELLPGLEVVTTPDRTEPDCSWRSSVYRIEPMQALDTGQRVRVHYRYRTAGEAVSIEILNE